MLEQSVREIVTANNRQLTFVLPDAFVHRKLEVLIIPLDSPSKEAWPADFFAKTSGCFSDAPVSRAPQGEPDERNALL